MRAVPGLGCCGFLFFFFFLFPPSSPFSSLSPSIALVEIFIVGGETKEGFRRPKTKLGWHGMVWGEFRSEINMCNIWWFDANSLSNIGPGNNLKILSQFFRGRRGRLEAYILKARIWTPTIPQKNLKFPQFFLLRTRKMAKNDPKWLKVAQIWPKWP